MPGDVAVSHVYLLLAPAHSPAGVVELQADSGEPPNSWFVGFGAADHAVAKSVAGSAVAGVTTVGVGGIAYNVAGNTAVTFKPITAGAGSVSASFIEGLHSDVVTGTSIERVYSHGQFQGFYSYPTESTPTVPPVSSYEPMQSAEIWLWTKSASLPASLRDAVREEFSDLMEAFRESSEVVLIDSDSITTAMRFLSVSTPKIPPQISITDAGYLYLLWFDGKDALLGVTFKSNGKAIWSYSQGNPAWAATRTAEAGERPAELLPSVLLELAKWVFSDDRTRRSVAA